MSPLRAVLDDLTALFAQRDTRLWGVLLGSLVLQVGYWYIGGAGPGGPRDPLAAATSVTWAVLLLFLLPALLWRWLGLSLGDAGLRRGDARAGLRLTLVGVALVVPVAFLATLDPALRATYPLPGPEVAGDPGRFLVWAALYSAYYLSYEFFYRGFLLRGVEPFWGAGPAIWLQTAASTLLHLGKPLAETLAAIPAGLLFGVLAVRTRSLLYPILIHLALGLAVDLFSAWRQGAFG